MFAHAQAQENTLPLSHINTAVENALQQHQNKRGNLLPILHDIQDALTYIPSSAVPLLAKALNLSRAEIHGVIHFYPYFRDTPAAPIKLEVCRAEACQSMGANTLARHIQARLGCGFQQTSATGDIDLEPVYCLGLCAQSPAMAINGHPYSRVNPDKFDALLEQTRSRLNSNTTSKAFP